jgi:hypothetical protein
MGKDLAESDPGRSKYCLGICIEELRKTTRKTSVRKPVSQQIFEPNTSGIKFLNVTARPCCSDR